MLALVISADGHIPSVAGVLGIHPHSVGSVLGGRATRSRWFAWRRARSEHERRAMWLRKWWRRRLRRIGVDPIKLPPTDPLWHACHRFPRGYWLRVVAAEMRAEHPGESLATEERIDELLARVAVLVAEHLSTVTASTSAHGSPPASNR